MSCRLYYNLNRIVRQIKLSLYREHTASRYVSAPRIVVTVGFCTGQAEEERGRRYLSRVVFNGVYLVLPVNLADRGVFKRREQFFKRFEHSNNLVFHKSDRTISENGQRVDKSLVLYLLADKG